MESMDHVRERFDALEQQPEPLKYPTQALQAQTRPGERRRLCPWPGAAVAALGLALALPLSVQAKTFRCGARDVTCLIDAINTANANGEANTIRLAAGTYTLTAADNGPRFAANGLPVITSPLTITGRGADTTIIERDASAERFRILQVATTSTLTLKRLTLRGGSSQSSGGGIWNDGTLALVHTTVADNRTSTDGGGILNEGTLTLVRTTVADNRAENPLEGGGGIAHYGTTLTITHSIIERNIAESAGAGGIRIGPFFEDPVGIARVATITATSITRNAAFRGGGIITHNATVIITASAISENLAGGGFRGVDWGGGILNRRGIMEITNTTIAANISGTPSGGGGIGGDGIATEGGTLLLINSTVAENGRPLGSVAPFGNGIQVDGGTVLLQNTIVTGHNRSPSPFASGDCLGPVTTLGNNLIGDPTGCTITLLPSDLTGDPGFGPFTDNGRPGNGHFPLLPTSQAIDAGNDAVCPRTDQLGQRRLGPCDIGAITFRDRDDRHQEDDDQEDDDQEDKEHDDPDPVAAVHVAP